MDSNRPVVSARRIAVFRLEIAVADHQPIPGAVGELGNDDGVKAGWVPTVEAQGTTNRAIAIVLASARAAITPVVIAGKVVVIVVAEPAP